MDQKRPIGYTLMVFLGLEFLVLESISIPKVLGPNLKSHW